MLRCALHDKRRKGVSQDYFYKVKAYQSPSRRQLPQLNIIHQRCKELNHLHTQIAQTQEALLVSEQGFCEGA
ncbi:hypothetical protein AUC43_00210 [Hymenobacter sedentarius]|uniref:Uncharacterized protein n=1 Tax=Hymenobacter sedentarius TaxID=1411621 RepID=A0A0U4AJ97_9BACT|nr:hypothetical protein AUC43_00210 [Hymenobacter sedentarius]